MSGTFLIRNSNPVVAGHEVHGLKILPGLAYIDLIYQFFRRRGREFDALELRNLAIHQPMVLPGADDVLVEIAAQEIRPGVWQVGVDGTRQCDGRAVAERVRHAVAEMHACSGAFDASEDQAILPLPQRRLETEHIYPAFRQRGLVHNGFMRVHGLGFSTSTHAFADVALGEEAAASDARYMFHPALLDGSVTCACGMLPGAESEGAGESGGEPGLYIPLSYESFRASALVRGRCIARIDHASMRRRKDLFLISVDFLDGAGRKIAELKNLALKALRHSEAVANSPAAIGVSGGTAGRSETAASPSTPRAPSHADGERESRDIKTFLRDFVAGAIARRLELTVDQIDPTVGYYEMGLDSVGLLQVVQLLESKLGISLSPTLLFEYTTVEELAAHLLERHGEQLGRLMGAAPEQPEASIAALDGAHEAPTFATRSTSRASATGSTSAACDLALIGMAGRFPQARDIRELWRNLKAGRDCIEEIPAQRWDWHLFDGMQSAAGHAVSRWGGFVADADCFDARFFRITPRAAEIIDPQERLFLEVSWEAIEDAGYTPKNLVQPRGAYKRRDVGVFAGVMHKDYLLWQTQRLLGGEVQSLSMSNAAIANRVSYFCNFHGPSIVLDTLCSSSLTAVHMAAESLRHGECEVALAGGVNLSLHPGKYMSFALLGMHSSDGRCRTFGAGGDGYVAADGVGVVVMKPLARALADGDHVHAVLKASCANHVGTVSGISVPSPVAQADLIASCLDSAGIEPRSISYVEAHGTGTALGDPIEIEGLSKAFRAGTDALNFCAIGSIKSNIGHAESAAGIAGLIKLALQLRHATLVPSLHGDEPNPHIDWTCSPFVLQRRTETWQRPQVIVDGRERVYPLRGTVSSFGAAGSNAHVVLEEFVAESVVVSAHGAPAVVPLSAQTAEQLRAAVQRLLEHMSDADAAPHDVHAIACTLQRGREAQAVRAAFVAADAATLRDALAAYLGDRPAEKRWFAGARRSAEQAASAGDAGRAQTLRWLADGQVEEIAHAWAQGDAVDWSALYAAGAPRRVSLPTYPFAKERYWVEGVGADVRNSRGARAAAPIAVLHPLLHENTSDLDEQRFSSRFDGEEFFLRDHVVKGARVLPGVVFLEMAHAALRRGANAALAHPFGLRNVVWAQPVVAGGSPVTLQVALFRSTAGELGCEIYSRNDDARVVHFQSAAASLSSPPPRLDLAALKSRCHGEFPVEDCYRLLDSSGLSYGAAFRVMRQIAIGRDDAGELFVLAQLALPSSLASDAHAFELHPSMVDGALQSSIGLLLAQSAAAPNEGAQLQPYLPYALERLDVLAACPAEAVVVVRNAPGNSARLRKLDVTVCDAAGNVCIELRGFGARLLEKPIPTPGQAAPDATPQAPLTLVEEWQPQALAADRQANSGAVICVLGGEAQQELLQDTANAFAPQLQAVFVAPLADADTPQQGPSVDSASYALALSSAAEQCSALQAIVALWPVQRPPSVADYRPLIAFLQGLSAANLAPLRVVLGAVCRTPLERAYVDSWIGIVPSLKRLLPHTLQVVGVVVDEHASDEVVLRDAFGKILSELGDASARSAFYLGGIRHVRRMLPTQRGAAPGRLREGATYLITGGLGGLGSALAQRLAHKYRANLLLIGRSAPDAAARDKLRVWQSRGNRVLYAQADIADAAALRATIDAARPELGTIAGVFHVAGVNGSDSVFDAPYAEFARVLAPKVSGTLALEHAFEGSALEFICHFSSSSSLLGDFGPCSYAVANRFQTAFARYAAPSAGCVRCAINWPLWRDGGLRIGDPAATDLYLQSSGQRALASEEGLELLERLLAEPHAQQLVLTGEPAALRRLLAGAGVPVDGTAERAPVVAEAPAPSNDPLAPRLLRHLRALLGEAVKMPLERVAADMPLDEYGFDSILAMQMTNELEKAFGSLSKTLFFEHRDLESLNRYLLQAHRAAVRRLFGVEDEQVVASAPAPAVSPLRQQRGLALPTSAAVADAREIAIVGISGRFPGARDLDEFWLKLRAGADCVGEVPVERWDSAAHFDARKSVFGKTYCRWGGFLDDIDAFDPLFFNMTPVEAQFTDPQQRLWLETVWNLLESSGYTREALQQTYGGNVGVYVGSMYNQYGSLSDDLGADAVSTSPQGGIANRVSYFFGLSGPSIAVDTMCSSAFVAIHMACTDLTAGVCALAIAGGVNLSIHPKKYVTLSQAQMLASDVRGRSFGATDGYLPAEGVGGVLLKPLERALADGDTVLAVIKASALNHGGRGSGYSAPNPAAQAEVMRLALRKAQCSAQSIGYVEAAANGSPLGDAIEMTALNNVFAGCAAQGCAIGAVKSNIGHAEAASGMAQLAKVLLQLRHGELVPSIEADPPNPRIAFETSPFRLQRELAPWPQAAARRALINSFGAGGSNACLVIEAFGGGEQQPAGADERDSRQIVVVSARSFERLAAQVRALAAWLAERPVLLADVAYTLQCGREAMAARLALVVSSREELLAGLEAYLSEKPLPSAAGIVSFVAGPAESAALSSFVGGSAGQALLETFLRERDLEKLAMFWANGGKVAWSALHSRRRRLLPLPNYAFAKQRYWLPRGVAAAPQRSVAPTRVATFAVDGRRALPLAHPLLHANTSDLVECRFSSTFDGGEIFAVRERVRDVRLLPDAIYFEMLRGAVQRLTGQTPQAALRFVDLRWYGPIVIAHDTVTVHVALRAVGADRFACEIYSSDAAQDDAAGARIVHCRATALLAAAPDAPARIDLAALRARASNTTSTAAWYAMLGRLGLEYGASYTGAGEIRRGADLAAGGFLLADLALGTDAEAACDAGGLAPMLLNTALQAAALQIADADAATADAAGVKVPTALSCEELLLLAPLPPKASFHVQRSLLRHASVDVEVFDAGGTLCARFAGIAALAPSSDADAGATPAADGRYDIGRAPLLVLAHRDVVAPRNDLETSLLGIWRDALGFDAIGVFDAFLDLGGNSLSAARVVAKIHEQYRVTIDLPALLVPESTIAHLSALLVGELARQVAAQSTDGEVSSVY